MKFSLQCYILLKPIIKFIDPIPGGSIKVFLKCQMHFKECSPESLKAAANYYFWNE